MSTGTETTTTNTTESFVSQAIKCDKRQDKECLESKGAGSCCYYAKVLDIPYTQTQPAKDEMDGQKALGWPITDGEETFFCLDQVTWLVYSNAKSQKYFHNKTEISYRGYCAKSMLNQVV